MVAYALAGRTDIDFDTEPIGEGTDGPVFLRDIWPTSDEVSSMVGSHVKREMFKDV